MDVKELRELELQYCKSDMVYFIENYVHIEDKDNTENIVQPFSLWDSQKDTLKSIHDNRLNVILKARQLGISWLCMAYCSWCLLMNKGYTIIALSRTEEEAKELVRRLTFIYKYMPELTMEDCKENQGKDGIKYKNTTLSVEVSFPDGTSSLFKAFASSSGAARSFTGNILLLDEWAFQDNAKEIWDSAYPTINRPTGGKVIGLSTIKRGTLFEDIFTSDNGFNKIFLPWSADPRRTPEWYEQTKIDLPETYQQEYPATVEEALTILGGAFFPEFNEKLHCIPYYDLTENYKYVSLDYGLDMFAVLFHEVDAQGNDVIYKEIYEKDLIASKACSRLIEATGDEFIQDYYAPPDLWNRNRDTGRSTAEIFLDGGIYLSKTSNNRIQGALNIKELLAPIKTINEQTGEETWTSKVQIVANRCPNLVRCLKKIQKDVSSPNEYANDPHELTHIIDAFRCFCCGRPSKPSQIPKQGIFNFSWEKPKHNPLGKGGHQRVI